MYDEAEKIGGLSFTSSTVIATSTDDVQGKLWSTDGMPAAATCRCERHNQLSDDQAITGSGEAKVSAALIGASLMINQREVFPHLVICSEDTGSKSRRPRLKSFITFRLSQTASSNAEVSKNYQTTNFKEYLDEIGGSNFAIHAVLQIDGSVGENRERVKGGWRFDVIRHSCWTVHRCRYQCRKSKQRYGHNVHFHLQKKCFCFKTQRSTNFFTRNCDHT